MEKIPFQTPILFLIFNRPDTTEKVFQRIRELQPRFLFVSADGPRTQRENEHDQCEATRKIIQKVDWDCEVKTHFSNVNLGCKIGVSSGINWFFENVEEGIILEDDCLPDLSFFSFCEAMLQKYKHDERIMHIGGSNFQDGKYRGDGSYYFSRINHVWGWATWKRAWQKYDVTINSFPDLLKKNQFDILLPNTNEKKYWLNNFHLVYSNNKDTWDIQWVYAMTVHHGLAIIPNRNLVSNIGFEVGATHTFNRYDLLANRATEPLNNIHHPTVISHDSNADSYTFRKYLSPNKFRKLWRLLHQ
jgi:hypothetical protein